MCVMNLGRARKEPTLKKNRLPVKTAYRLKVALYLMVTWGSFATNEQIRAQHVSLHRQTDYSIQNNTQNAGFASSGAVSETLTQPPFTTKSLGRALESHAPSDYPASRNANSAAAFATSPPLVKVTHSAETLEDALNIAVEQSRTQRALALKAGASRSIGAAARTLRNPKINNTTSYVGMLNQPTTKSNVDLSGALSSITSSLPPEAAGALGPIIAGFPTQYQVATPLVDKNFVTTVTSITLPIYLGGRVEALVHEAEALTQAIAAGEQVDLQRVKLEATEAFFLVLRMRSLHRVTLDAVESTQAHLNDAVRMEKVGVLTRNVVLAAQVAHSEARQAELKVATALAMAESAYNRVLWRPLDAPVVLQDVEPNAPLQNIDALVNAAIANRGELQALSAEARAMQAQVRVAQADVKPQVAVVGAYSYLENSHMTGNNNTTAAIGMTWTPFDGGTSRARQNAARQSAMAITRLREEAEASIKLQVREAWLLQNEAYQRIEIAKFAVEQAEENLRVVTRGFQEGTLNHTEALDASTQCTAARSAYANAKYDAILASERLKRVIAEP